MKITDYLALWGAIISTCVACWNIYRDLIKRDRVDVRAGFKITFPPKKEVFAVTVTNISDHKIRITHCGGYYDRHFQSKMIDRIARKFQKRSTKAFLFSFQPYQGEALPRMVEPHDYTILMYTVPPAEFPRLESLAVTTADGREWFCPRADIKAIHADESYKAGEKETILSK